MLGFEIAAIVVIILIGALLVIELYVMTSLLMSLKNQIDKIQDDVAPLLGKAEDLLDTVNEVALDVQQKSARVSETTANTAETVSEGIASTSRIAQKVVTTPIISGMALLSGVERALEFWKNAHARRKKTFPQKENS